MTCPSKRPHPRSESPQSLWCARCLNDKRLDTLRCRRSVSQTTVGPDCVVVNAPKGVSRKKPMRLEHRVSPDTQAPADWLCDTQTCAPVLFSNPPIPLHAQ